MAKFDEFLKPCLVTRNVSFIKTKIGGKCQNVENENATFWVIFRHCEHACVFDWKILVTFFEVYVVVGNKIRIHVLHTHLRS